MKPIDRLQGLGCLLAIALAFPSCSVSPCTQFGIKPSNSVECPSGTLCYQGACVVACSAGGEERCDTIADCTDSLRPKCVRGFCTNCASEETCIPDLNICSAVVFVDGGVGSRDGGAIAAETPEDGGAVDGSVFARDGGAIGPVIDTPPTHITRILFSQVEDLQTMSRTASVSAQSLFVGNAGFTRSTSVATYQAALNFGCEIVRHEIFSGNPTPASIGDFNIDSALPAATAGAFECAPPPPMGMACSYKATFVQGGYLFDRRPPPALIHFSTVVNAQLIDRRFSVSGRSQMNVTGSWPAGQSVALRSPLEMRLAPALPPENPNPTRALMSRVINASDVKAEGLKLSWISETTSPIQGINVRFRMLGPTYDLVCSPAEDLGAATIPRCMLDIFATQAPPQIVASGGCAQCYRGECSADVVPNALGGQTIDFFFERRFGTELVVPPAPGTNFEIEATVEVLHSFHGRMLF